MALKCRIIWIPVCLFFLEPFSLLRAFARLSADKRTPWTEDARMEIYQTRGDWMGCRYKYSRTQLSRYSFQEKDIIVFADTCLLAKGRPQRLKYHELAPRRWFRRLQSLLGAKMPVGNFPFLLHFPTVQLYDPARSTSLISSPNGSTIAVIASEASALSLPSNCLADS